MAVPKKRRSKSKTRIHKAKWQLSMPQLRPCPNCGFAGLSHTACASCGFYKGRQVIQFKVKEEKTKED